MITVKEAKNLVFKNARRLPACRISLMDACGSVLAEDIHSPLALPLWDNSAMDGFVLKSEDTRKASIKNPLQLEIKDVIKAGDTKRRMLRHGEAMRIMTGGVIPEGANAVVAQEDARVLGFRLEIKEKIMMWNHVRRKGEEVSRGKVFRLRDSKVSPGTVAFLSSLGRTTVKVYRKPRVSVIVTGDELVKRGNKLKPGQIYESNSAMLVSALQEAGIKPGLVRTVIDNRRRITRVLTQALQSSDTVILAGGVSVGDYDFSREVLERLGVKKIFWKIAQKPGKPLYLGKLKQKLVFGLPGNPASAFVCFYEYVLPALRSQMGDKNPFLKQCRIKAQISLRRNVSKTLFLKALCTNEKDKRRIILLAHQGSHMVSSLHDTNAIAVIEPGPLLLQKGQEISVDLLPFSGT